MYNNGMHALMEARGSCDTVDVIRSAGLCVRYEEAAREQAQQGVSPDKQDRPPGVLPERRRRREGRAIRCRELLIQQR